MNLVRALALIAIVAFVFAGLAPLNARAATFTGVPANATELSNTTESVVDYALLLSAAEKVGRELRYDEALQVSGQRTRTLWQLPSGARLDAVMEQASSDLAGDVLFECQGRDCGRSTAWANLVYSQALVFGQDRFQRYRVVQTGANQLVALYVVQRGNRRVHLLAETIDTEGAIEQAGASAVRSELIGTGYVRLAVIPGESAEFSDADIAELKDVGRELSGLQVGTLYVVCHLYGAADTELLITQSEDCAKAAQAQISDGYAAAQNELPALNQANRARPPQTDIKTFGAGPLLPRLTTESSTENRLELVVPSQLRSP